MLSYQHTLPCSYTSILAGQYDADLAIKRIARRLERATELCTLAEVVVGSCHTRKASDDFACRMAFRFGWRRALQNFLAHAQRAGMVR
jgi:hypothetical protein